MGHANLSNISRTASRVLRTNGKATIKQIVDELDRTKQAIHASEGLVSGRPMLANACEEYVDFLRDRELIKPVALSPEQAKILKEWGTDAMDKWDCGDDGAGGEYGILDSICWMTERRHALPLLRRVTH